MDRRASSLDNQTGKPSLTPLSRTHARQRTKSCQSSDDSYGDDSDDNHNHNGGDDSDEFENENLRNGGEVPPGFSPIARQVKNMGCVWSPSHYGHDEEEGEGMIGDSNSKPKNLVL